MFASLDRRPVRKLATVLAAVGLMACGSDDGGTGLGPDDDDVGGSFSATISGDVNADISGFAVQGQTTVDPDTGDQGWAAFLGRGEDQGDAADAVFFVRLGARPAQGTYALEDIADGTGVETGEFAGFVALGLGSQTVQFSGFSLSGTLTITSSSPDRVAGTFDFQASGFDPTQNPPAEQVVSVSGTFDAVSETAFNVPGF